MNSKISCWRFVRSTIAQRAPRADSKTNVCSTSLQRRRTDPQGTRPSILTAHARARGGIGRRARLRALWGVSPVVVRVHSSAFLKRLPDVVQTVRRRSDVLDVLRGTL